MNVKELREKQKLTQEQLAEKTGIPRDRIAKWEQGKGSPKAEDYKKLEKFFGKSKWDNVPRELNIELSEETIDYNKTNGHDLVKAGNDDKNYILKRRRLKALSEAFMVPLVPVKAQAGYARAYSNTDFLNNLEMYPILPGIDPRGAVWRFFEVQGESMEPGLYETDLVLVSQVTREDWKNIKKGQVYVIVTSDEVMIKLVFPMDKDRWVLKSSNRRHKDKMIDATTIKEVWQFRRLVSNKIQISTK
jgi:phage repressor protein C with HTH and peptisase S24 domain